MIIGLCLAAIVLMLGLVVQQLRRHRARAQADAATGFAQTHYVEAHQPPVQTLSAPLAMADVSSSPAASVAEAPAPMAALGIPRPSAPSAAAPAEMAGHKVITIIHDFGHPRDFPTDQRRYLSTREAFEILAEIRSIPPETPIDFILHTPGGEAFACELIAMAIKDRPNTTAYVPYCAMSAGTIVALACEKIVMGRYACLGPIDTQFYGFPIESYIRLLKDKPMEAITDEVVLLCYLAEKEMKTARARACELLNKNHFGKDEACQLTDFLVAGDMPHSEQISRDRAITIGVNIGKGECPTGVYEFVEQRLRIFQSRDDYDGYGPDYQVRATMTGHRLPQAAAGLPAGFGQRFGTYTPARREKAALPEMVLRTLVDAACNFIVKKFAKHAPTKSEVRAMEGEIKTYLKEAFGKFTSLLEAHWKEIFEKIVAVFPD